MNYGNNMWQKLFLFCLGLFIAAGFCMKWMEGDFLHNGSLFTIIGLEIIYPQEKVLDIFSGLDDKVKTILRYHLLFDFVYMAGVFPGIAALCMIARKKSDSSILKIILLSFAFLQLVAWGCDIYENLSLLKWLKDPAMINGFAMYHFIVTAKWIIALIAVLLAIPFAIRQKKIIN